MICYDGMLDGPRSCNLLILPVLLVLLSRLALQITAASDSQRFSNRTPQNNHESLAGRMAEWMVYLCDYDAAIISPSATTTPSNG